MIMERKAVISSMLMWVLVVGLMADQSNAWFKDFKNCLKDCVVQCVIPPWTPVCPASCLAKCVIHPSDLPSPHQYCTIGCATSSCSKFITKQNPDLDQVERCVDGCSGTCTSNYVPAN